MSAAEAPLQPVTVCEVLHDLNDYNGKVVMVVGRFSFRKTGRSLNEETCESKPAKTESPDPAGLSLAYDPKTAPKPASVFEIDAAVLRRKLKQVKAATSLREFRFGSSDYDRWAGVYGRVETRPAPARGSERDEQARNNSGTSPVPAQLLYCGDGVIVFLDDVE